MCLCLPYAGKQGLTDTLVSPHGILGTILRIRVALQVYDLTTPPLTAVDFETELPLGAQTCEYKQVPTGCFMQCGVRSTATYVQLTEQSTLILSSL